MRNVIYFDQASTTAMHPQVVQAYMEMLKAGPANPSSLHSFGRYAKQQVRLARDNIARLLEVDPIEIVFTASGTESNNAALVGAAFAQRKFGRNQIVLSAIEHDAVRSPCHYLETMGFALTVLPVDEFGRVDLRVAEELIDDRTAIVSVMAGNNEVGTLQPIREIGSLAHQHGAMMHVDAIQAFGYLPFALQDLPIDFMSMSSHKINGPQGVGLLYIRRGIPFLPLLYGGRQERNRRAGTENVPGIVAFSKAVELAYASLPKRWDKVNSLSQAMLFQLNQVLGADKFILNGHLTQRLPQILNLSFPWISAESLLINLDLLGVAASSGSACQSGSHQASHVLKAMGLSSQRIDSSVRFSFGLDNTIEEVTKAVQIIATIFTRYS